MGRIMAIDVGQKRIGLAVTDPQGIIATGLDTVNVSEVFNYLSGYAEGEKLDMFLVGMPVQLNNMPSDSVKYVEPFIKKLKKAFPSVPVRLADERFTSKLAMQAMIDGGLGKKARQDKALVDKISAVILLQSYLDGKYY
jgi:putative holliday junction resolvase